MKKHTRRKRAIAWFLAVIIVIALLPAASFSNENVVSFSQVTFGENITAKRSMQWGGNPIYSGEWIENDTEIVFTAHPPNNYSRPTYWKINGEWDRNTLNG